MNQPDNSQKTPEGSSHQQSHPPKPPRGLSRRPYPLEMRRLAVRLHEQEKYSLTFIAQQLDLDRKTIHAWVKRYRAEGDQGLCDNPTGPKPGRQQLPAVVQQKIVELKQQHLSFGVRKIAQWLRRVLCLPVSAETVRQMLHREQLMETKRRKPRRNPPKPRFFERATPNQMWQSDIFTWRLHGKNAYLIGFIDDHSRYIVGLGLFRSQTAEHVLEVYRTAVGEYGVPKEMLTDNGRQYTTWRGTTRFEQELRKDRVHQP